MKIKGDKEGEALSIKILTLGGTRIGKACLVERFITNSFKENFKPKIGVDVRIIRLEINNFKFDVKIFDTVGQERFRSITKMYYKMVDGILLGFDLTNKNTFDQLDYWIAQIEANKKEDFPISLVLFGNKYDDKEHIEVKDEDIELKKKKYNLEYFATSAKDGTNVQNIFEYLIKTTIKAKGLLDKIGLSSDIPIDDISIKVKEMQKLETMKSRKRKMKKNSC